MTAETRNKLHDLLNDDEVFARKAMSAADIEEITAIFKEYNLDITAEEFLECCNEGQSVLKDAGYISDDGELTEAALDFVVGGKNGKGTIHAGLTVIGVSFASDYLAGACAIAIVSNPAGWFFIGIGLFVAGHYIASKKKR